MNLNNCTISVIIPVYNVAGYLSRCLDSVLLQTYSDIEVICVDDGSTDGSSEILADYFHRDNRIRIISQANFGQSAARNAGLKQISGEYVFFVDADDFIHKQTLEILLKVMQKTEVPVVAIDDVKHYSGALIDLENLQYTVHHNPLEHILQNEASGSVIWNKLYKADLVRNRQFIKGIYFEDWPWTTCLFADVKNYATVPYALYGYNTENASTMRSVFTMEKVWNFAVGIRATQKYFADFERQHLWPLVRKKRICASIKHMVNAVYHEKENQPELEKFLVAMLSQLRQAECFFYYELPLKVLMRIFKIWLRNRRRK